MSLKMIKTSYSQAILEAFQYLLKNYPEVFVLGQGLWSPWYVGKTMENLDKEFGKSRIIDTPVSESACTGAAVGASICGMKPIVVHPRMDFMLYAMDAIVNQAAKWSYMFDGKSNPSLTIRAIINRGGSQGAQHSQALQSWFAHIPGLRVVMPYSVQDARDLLISSVLCPDPVIYIDDRWLYEQTSLIKPIEEKKIDQIEPKIILEGNDLTLVGSSYSTHLAKEAAKKLLHLGINVEVIDMRVISPMKINLLKNSVQKTRRLVVVDGGWSCCGISAEIITAIMESTPIGTLVAQPKRITLANCPAPSTENHETIYYPNIDRIVFEVENIFRNRI